MTFIIIGIYVLVSLLAIMGVMYFMRRKREKELNIRPTNKIKDIKAEQVNNS